MEACLNAKLIEIRFSSRCKTLCHSGSGLARRKPYCGQKGQRLVARSGLLPNVNATVSAPTNPADHQMRMHAGPKQALMRAYVLIEKGLDSQAQLWAYVDDFRYLSPLCIVYSRYVLLQKTGSWGKGCWLENDEKSRRRSAARLQVTLR
jgi:hypothetical protein